MIVNIARKRVSRLNLTIHFSLFRGLSATIRANIASGWPEITGR
jgi:hypothetical protein